jgi:hypothetical protein
MITGRLVSSFPSASYQAVRLSEHDLEGLLVLDRRIGDALEHVLRRAVAHRPAADRGDHVGASDVLPVVEFLSGAQRERVGLLVVGDAPAVDHLRLGLARLVHAEQRVVDQQRVIAGHVGGGPDRIEDLEVAMQHGAQRARARGCGLSLDEVRSGECRGDCRTGFDERSA